MLTATSWFLEDPPPVSQVGGSGRDSTAGRRDGGLDKGCVRCPESDTTNRCPCPRTGDLDGDGHQARRGGPQSSSGGGGCLGPAWPRVPGSVDDRGAETPTSPVRGDSPLALGDRAGSLPRRPCPGGRWGRRRGVCGSATKTPARVIVRRRRGLGAPLVQATTLRRVRSGNKGARPAPSPLGWWPSGHGENRTATGPVGDSPSAVTPPGAAGPRTSLTCVGGTVPTPSAA